MDMTPCSLVDNVPTIFRGHAVSNFMVKECSSKLHSITSQKIKLFIFTAIRTSDLTKILLPVEYVASRVTVSTFFQGFLISCAIFFLHISSLLVSKIINLVRLNDIT